MTKIKNYTHSRLIALMFLFFISAAVTSSQAAENWKGKTESPPIEVGGMIGMNLFGSEVNWSLLGTAGYLVVPNGWVDDIDERIWAEMELGPSFFSSGGYSKTGLQYSGHIRWDFTYNSDWIFYALGGLGGYYLPEGFGGHMTIAPRFGLGAQFQSKLPMMFRGEFSHEFIGVGLSFNF